MEKRSSKAASLSPEMTDCTVDVVQLLAKIGEAGLGGGQLLLEGRLLLRQLRALLLAGGQLLLKGLHLLVALGQFLLRGLEPLVARRQLLLRGQELLLELGQFLPNGLDLLVTLAQERLLLGEGVAGFGQLAGQPVAVFALFIQGQPHDGRKVFAAVRAGGGHFQLQALGPCRSTTC